MGTPTPPPTDNKVEHAPAVTPPPAENAWANVAAAAYPTTKDNGIINPNRDAVIVPKTDGSAGSTSVEAKTGAQADPPTEVKKTEGDKPAEATLESLPKLTGEDLQRAQYLQDTLKSLMPVFQEVKLTDEQKNLPPDQRRELIEKETTANRDALAKEREAGVFGPATQKAYEQYTNFLQKAVPGTIRELDSMLLALPPGTPIALDSDAQGRSIDPRLYQRMAADDRLALDLKLEPGKLPTDAQLDKLDATYNWLAKSNETVAEARGKQRDTNVDKLITDNGLPEGWKKQPGDDPVSWRNSAEEMVDLSLRTRNYVEAMQSLFKASHNDDFPIELPRGAKIVVEDKAGVRHTIADNQVNDWESKNLLKNGTIKEVKLDLPKDLRQEDPANKEKIDVLRNWLDKHGDKINQAVGELQKMQENPDAVIMFGDQEVSHGKAVINANGEFTKLVSGKYQPVNGEKVEEMNLIGYDFQVEQIKEGPDAGKYKVTQQINAEKAPWYAYENIRAFGIDRVGSMSVPPKILGADDFVPVRNGDKIEMVKAKNLESFKGMQQFGYYGEKALTITMDVAMTATGVVEVAAAYKGARLAAIGAEQAIKLGFKEAAWEGGKGAVRTLVGAAGIFNNAGARDTDWGKTVNNARGIYFLGDIGLGLASSGWGAFRAGKAVDAMTSAEKMQTIIRGREAVNGAEAIKGMGWVADVHKGTELAFKATELGFAPVIIADLRHQYNSIAEMGKRNPLQDAMIQVGDGRGLQLAGKGAFNPNDQKSLEAARTVVDGYESTLTRGRTPETTDEIKAIMDKTKTLMGPDATEADKAKFRQELLGKIVFTPEQMKALELADPDAGSFTEPAIGAKNFNELLDPDKRKDYPKEQAELAEKFLSEKNPDVLAASRVALLYLSRDADGKINPELATAKYEVPEYKKGVYHEGSGESPGWTEEVTVKAHTVDQSISSAEVVRDLKTDLQKENIGNRGIVTGEVLTRIGALTHQQYGGVLENVLRDPNATREDKLSALADANGPRMAAIIDGVRYQESQPQADTSKVGQDRAIGKAHGLDSEALLKQLETTARTDKDPDVRALSAALLHGLRDKAQLDKATNSPDQETRAIARNLLDGNPDQPGSGRKDVLSGSNTTLEQNRSTPGEVAKKYQEFLQKEMQTPIPDKPPALADLARQTRLDAAQSLALITGDDPKAQMEITKAIVSSFSPTDIALSTKVIDAMMPDRMAQLQKEDPALANKLRKDSVDLVKLPNSLPEEANTVKLLEKLEPLLREGPVKTKQDLQYVLKGMLDNSSQNDKYATFYPSLRAAAIDSLAASGSRESLDIIRSHVTAQESLKLPDTQKTLESGPSPLVGVREIAAGETDAKVRMAAIRALEKLNDPMLRNVVNDLVDKETDPTVASQLRDVQFTQVRLEPSSQEWKRMYEDTRADIIGFGKDYPYLETFDHDQARAWMNNNFPLLDQGNFMNAAKSAVDNENGWWYRRFHGEDTINASEKVGFERINKNREAQYQALVDMAHKGGDMGNKAKLALYYIATQAGSVMGSESGVAAGSVQGYYNSNHYHQIAQPDWKVRAANALKDLANSNVESRDVIKKVIKDGLTVNKEVSPEARRALLSGWESLATPDKNGYAVPREELARVTSQALKLETTRLKGAQDGKFQEQMIKDLQKYGDRRVMPILQALVDESKTGNVKPETAKAAQDMINTYTHATSDMWTATQPDQNATSVQRADQVKAGLADGTNSEATVQAIFNAYKGHSITDANDPGLTQLELAMNEPNERVRLAAARVLMDSDLPLSNSSKRKAMAALAAISQLGTNDVYKMEALTILQNNTGSKKP